MIETITKPSTNLVPYYDLSDVALQKDFCFKALISIKYM